MVLCFVSSFKLKDIKKQVGALSEGCKIKREDYEAFLDVDSGTKVGREAVSAPLRLENEQLWFNNPREGSKCYVSNPKNRSKRKIG